MSDENAKSDRTGRNATDPGGMPGEFVNNDEVNTSGEPTPPEGSGEALDEIDESDLQDPS